MPKQIGLMFLTMIVTASSLLAASLSGHLAWSSGKINVFDVATVNNVQLEWNRRSSRGGTKIAYSSPGSGSDADGSNPIAAGR